MNTVTHRSFLVLVLVVSAILATVGIQAAAQDGEEITLPVAKGLELKEGDGRDTVVSNCLKCHTMKPIITHEGLTDEAWASEVDKMRDKYGAPVSDEDAAVIVTYLQTYYSDKPPSTEDLILYGFENAMATPRAGEADAGSLPVATHAQQPSD